MPMMSSKLRSSVMDGWVDCRGSWYHFHNAGTKSNAQTAMCMVKRMTILSVLNSTHVNVVLEWSREI